MWLWTIVIGGYLAPALISGLAMRPAADALRRWGRTSTSVR